MNIPLIHQVIDQKQLALQQEKHKIIERLRQEDHFFSVLGIWLVQLLSNPRYWTPKGETLYFHFPMEFEDGGKETCYEIYPGLQLTKERWHKVIASGYSRLQSYLPMQELFLTMGTYQICAYPKGAEMKEPLKKIYEATRENQRLEQRLLGL